MKSKALNNKIFLKGLVVGCPLGTPSDDCPLNGLRTIPVDVMNSTVDQLDDETVDLFFATHTDCFKQRSKERKMIRKQIPVL